MPKLKWNGLWIAPMLVALFVLGGCSHAALEQKIDEKVAQEAGLTTRAELRTETDKLIEAAPGLSDAQRSGLQGVSQATRSQVDQIRAASIKLRSVLIKDMVTTQFNEDEVELIKDRLRSLEDKRISVIFEAVGQVNTILGRDARLHPEIARGFVDGHAASRMD